MNATINYLPIELPTPEAVSNFRGLKHCWIIELPNVIVWSIDKEKCLCKARKIASLLPKLNKCD